MKKYFFEASKKQLEKPTEPKYLFCPAASLTVLAENEDEALEKAREGFRCRLLATGVYRGEIRMTGSCELDSDWNYGYGDERGMGTAEEQAALRLACTK